MNAIYNRQSKIPLSIPPVCTVVGCGGTGYWTALFLAMSGVEKIILIDPDIIEQSNLNRLPCSSKDVGRFKTAVLAGHIRSLRPDCNVITYNKTIYNQQTAQLVQGVVFCCTDSIKSQRLLWDYCFDHNLKYQRVGYDGTYLNVSRLYPHRVVLGRKSTAADGYTVTPSWVVPAVQAACAAVFSVLCKELTLTGDMKCLNI